MGRNGEVKKEGGLGREGGGKRTHLLPDSLGHAREGLLEQRLAHRLLGLVAVLRRLFRAEQEHDAKKKARNKTRFPQVNKKCNTVYT